MLQSRLFSKTQRTDPKDEGSKNAQLLIRAGFIRKNSSGVYTYLPLGWCVLQKIISIIREEMSAIGSEELLMPALVAKEYWEKTDRWNIDIAYKVKANLAGGSTGEEFALGWTHEEVITAMAAYFIKSYKDLPVAVYQIQTKFRLEPRAKSGILRGREFMMKDLYSFHATKEDLDKYYEMVADAYQKIFKRLDLNAVRAVATGGAFTKEYTDEFQVPAATGEDTICLCKKCLWAQNKEIAIAKEGGKCPKCGGVISETSAIEVGNIFKLGVRYSEPYNLYYLDEKGRKNLVIMGCYGIGVTRLMGTIVEVSNDKNGIIWPKSVSPYDLHLLCLNVEDKKVLSYAKKVYNELLKNKVDVLFDDRNISPGEKFCDADLIGITHRAVISEKTLDKGMIELKLRSQKSARLVSLRNLVKIIQ